MKTIGTLKRANVQVRRHNDRHPGLAFWLPAIALSLMASLATPASGALIVNFSVTGTTSENWWGFFEIGQSNKLIGDLGNISKISARTDSLSVEFNPGNFQALPDDQNIQSVEWYFAGEGVYDSVKFAFAEALNPSTTWDDLSIEPSSLDATEYSGFLGQGAGITFETTGGSSTFEVVPEPSSITLAGLIGVGAIVIMRRRAKRRKQNQAE
jgi:hypothetical protein